MMDSDGWIEQGKIGAENGTNHDISTPVPSVIVNGYCSDVLGPHFILGVSGF